VTRASKVLPPSVPLWFVPRLASEGRLAEALNRRLTTVVAGPGFGKSTLLGAWATDNDAAWYSIGPEDETLPTFAAGLVEALRLIVPELRAAMVEPIVKGLGGDAAAERARAEAFGTHLCEALEALMAADGALILDDVHEIARHGAAARLIEELVRQAPTRLHLLLSSRLEPPFGIERLRARGEVLSIDGQMLAFSEEELARFLGTSVNEDETPLAGKLHQLTGGWPAAVRLAVEALRVAPMAERARVLDGLSRPGGSLFAYLAQEVFAREPPTVRGLLRRTALFDRFNEDLCEALGMRGAASTIAGLLRRGLFLQARGPHGNWFSLHALVREFASRSWPLPPGEVRKLHRRAAAWFETRGHVEEALRSLAKAGDYPGLAGLLSKRGAGLVAAGRAQSVIELGEALPTDLRDPSIELVLGEAHAIRGEGDEALECFGRAAGGGESLSAALASRIGELHNRRGELNEAMRALERGRATNAMPADEALLLAAQARVHYMVGDFETSRSLAVRALELAETSGDDRSIASAFTTLCVVTGDDVQAGMTYLGRALEAAERAGDVHQISRIRTNMAWGLNMQGLHRDAMECLDVAIPLAEMSGFVHWVGLGLSVRGESRFASGRPEEAIADLEAARRELERERSRDVAFPLYVLGDIHRQLGNLAHARGAYEEAVAAAERAHNVDRLRYALAGLARVLASEDPDQAVKLAERAVSYPEITGPLVAALLAEGWIALSGGDRTRATQVANQAVELARLRHEGPGLAESLELGAVSEPDPSRQTALLEEIVAMWRDMGNPVGQARAELALGRLSTGPGARARTERAERKLRALGVRTTPPLAAGLLASLPVEADTPVRIRTLGGFAVLRRGTVVPLAEWQSKKARSLLKILVARQGHPTPREFMMETLWPEENPDKVSHRLSVALATARAVLDPGRDFPQEEFITADNDVVGLDLSNLPVDVEEFLADGKGGLRMLHEDSELDAVEILQSAEAAYRGDFLEEDAYEDWATPLREEARALYLSVAKALAGSMAASGDHDTSARYFLRILERDPYDEGAHLGLVSALIEAGRHGEARRRYRTYVSKMGEIDVEAAPFPASSRPSPDDLDATLTPL